MLAKKKCNYRARTGTVYLTGQQLVDIRWNIATLLLIKTETGTHDKRWVYMYKYHFLQFSIHSHKRTRTSARKTTHIHTYPCTFTHTASWTHTHIYTHSARIIYSYLLLLFSKRERKMGLSFLILYYSHTVDKPYK